MDDGYRLVLVLSPLCLPVIILNPKRNTDFFDYFPPFFSFWLLLHFSSPSANFWYHLRKGTNKNSEGRKVLMLVTINQDQDLLRFSCSFSYVNCLMLQNSCWNSRHQIYRTQKAKDRNKGWSSFPN